jgi:beta-lactamase regulating signal transducer with metallopeptidase domain
MHFLTLFVDWLLAASARASLLTAVVFIIQSLVRYRVPARWRYAMWIPVLVVLLVPSFPESKWSVHSIIRLLQAPLAVPVSIEPPHVLDVNALGVADFRMTVFSSWQQMVPLAWLIGSAGIALFHFGAFVQTLRRFKRSQVPASDALLNEVAGLARDVGLRRTPRVCIAREIRTPAVTGLLHPMLLLPVNIKETLSFRELQFVLRHELTHIKRCDLPLNALLCVLLSLHWFNPVLWFAFFKARLDRESACDDEVLHHEQLPGRVAYGHTLLKMEDAFGYDELRLGFVGIFQRGAALRSRIQSIAREPTHHPAMKTTLIINIVLLSFLGITKATPTDTTAPKVLFEVKFIDVSEEALELLGPSNTTSGSSNVLGMLNNVQFSPFLKKINGLKGVDVLATPQVTSRSGQKAKIEIGREFAYKDAEDKATTKNLGTKLTLLPKVTGEDQIDVDISSLISEFEDFSTHADGAKQPIFSEQKLTANVSITSGQTVVLGFPARSAKQITEERSAGGITTSTENVTRHRVVFVTAHLVDSTTGKPVGPKLQN